MKIDLTSKFKKLDQQSPERLFLLKFWLRMGEAYRQMWVNGQGSLPSDLWATYLLKIGEKRATAALINCLKTGKTYPPTLSEFIVISKPLPSYYSETPNLPKPKPNEHLKAVGFTALAQMKKSVGIV